ncbi:MAG: hypothetical protein ACPGVI_03135 [Crocinitomicaceae bacterium]
MWEEKVKIYDELVAKCPDFKRKGKTVPYTSSNGHMFSLINKDGELGIRLSKDAGEAFKEKYNTGDFFSHGAKMRGYVLIPDELLNDLDNLAKYLKLGYNYVMSLDPK